MKWDWNRYEFRQGSRCARRWLIARLSSGHGSFRAEYRRLWDHALSRSTVDSWSAGFFFEVDLYMPEAFDWHYGMDPLPRKLCPGVTTRDNAPLAPTAASMQT